MDPPEVRVRGLHTDLRCDAGPGVRTEHLPQCQVTRHTQDPQGEGTEFQASHHHDPVRVVDLPPLLHRQASLPANPEWLSLLRG